MYLYVYIYIYTYNIYVCKYGYIYISIFIYTVYAYIYTVYVYTRVCLFVCVCVCVCVCRYIHTLHCQKYSLTYPKNWNQVFQSLPWPQVYKSKHLGMQAVSTNICERMDHSQWIPAWYSDRTVLVSMTEQLHPSHTSASVMQRVGGSGVKHATTGHILWSDESRFSI